MVRFCAVFALTVFLRFGQGDSAIRAGSTITPFAVGVSVGAVVASAAVVPRIGRGALQVGAALMGLGSLWTWQVVDSDGLATATRSLIGPQFVVGVGVGMLLAPLISFVVSPVSDAEVGSATGVFNAAQQLASAAGVAIVGTIFFSVSARNGFVAAYGRLPTRGGRAGGGAVRADLSPPGRSCRGRRRVGLLVIPRAPGSSRI